MTWERTFHWAVVALMAVAFAYGIGKATGGMLRILRRGVAAMNVLLGGRPAGRSKPR